MDDHHPLIQLPQPAAGVRRPPVPHNPPTTMDYSHLQGEDVAAPAWSHELLEPIRVRLDAIDTRLTSLEVMATRNHNMAAGNGDLLEVPFPDGGRPGQFNLPVLTTHNVVSGLNRRQLREYHQHYYPDAPVPWELIACKAAICKAIGCKGINTIDWE